MSTNRIVFLDLDGPLINTGCFGISKNASMLRQVMNTSSIGWLNILTRETGARIVCNSTHNYEIMQGRNLQQDLIRHGLDAEYLHADWRTLFPNTHEWSMQSNRLIAILEWQSRHPEVEKWVCFDDIKFSDNDERLIVVDFDDGILKCHIQKAFNIFGVQPKGLFL